MQQAEHSARSASAESTPSPKAPFVEPKLTFVEPKLEYHGSLSDVTAGFFGIFSP